MIIAFFVLYSLVFFVGLKFILFRYLSFRVLVFYLVEFGDLHGFQVFWSEFLCFEGISWVSVFISLFLSTKFLIYVC